MEESLEEGIARDMVRVLAPDAARYFDFYDLPIDRVTETQLYARGERALRRNSELHRCACLGYFLVCGI